jgi:D-threo-aldose 1-dehydrogenase
MNQSAMLTDFVRDFDIDVVLIAGRYSLLDPSAAEDLLPMCLARGTSVVVGGVFNSGLLADPQRNTHFDYAPAEQNLIDRALQMQAICRSYDVPLRAAAVQYVLRHPAVSCALIGTRTSAQVRDAIDAMDTVVPDECWAELGV